MSVRFEWFHHLVTVPVVVGGADATFVVDTGIGLPIVATALFERAGGERTGETFTGKRMSGQEVEVPLGVVPGLRVGERAWDEVTVGLADLAAVDGFLSLGLLSPFVVDYPAAELRFGTVPGVEVPIRVERQGISAAPFASLTLPTGEQIEVEVDMGSDSLILDERYLGTLEVDVEREERGADETGHEFVRTFGRLHGSIAVGGVVQDDPAVMFQAIVYDGLVGQAFLRRHVVAFDADAGRMVLG